MNSTLVEYLLYHFKLAKVFLIADWKRGLSFQHSEQENEQRRRLQLAAANQEEKTSPSGVKNGGGGQNPRRQQEAVISELRSRSTTVHNKVHEKKLLPAEEVYHGALEDILLGLKSEPYRRADAVRRSQRRRNNTNRLSRNIDDLEASF